MEENTQDDKNTSFSFKLMNGPNKLECYSTLGWNDLPETKLSNLFGPFESVVNREKYSDVFKR